jgi:APA family basic amino acid/polyamine antiporter
MRVDAAQSGARLERQLTLFDSVMIVVGGTIGASIFIVPADVLRAVPNPAIMLLLWVLVGGITMIAGLACGELGAMYPEAGGQYVFIREAYGRFAAFLYGWVLFTAGNSSALAAMAISSAIFIGRAFPQFAPEHVVLSLHLFRLHLAVTRETVFAVGAVVLLTAVNLRSVRIAALLNNVTALGYLVVLGLIVAAGLLFGHGSWSHFHAPAASVMPPLTIGGLGLGMIALFFSYDGWEFLSWVGGEIKNPGRNLPLGLILGISLIVVAYLLANIVFLYALPPEVMARQPAVADAAMTALFSHDAGRWVSLFIGVISFGAASVVVLGGARIYYSMALDGVFFAGMSRIHPRWKTPTTALLAQCAWVIVLILSGRYEQLYTCFIFMMTMTYALTVGAVFILRRTQPDRPRPYRCAGYPWLPAIYIAVSVVFVVSTLLSRPGESIIGLAMAGFGIPLYLYRQRVRSIDST